MAETSYRKESNKITAVAIETDDENETLEFQFLKKTHGKS